MPAMSNAPSESKGQLDTVAGRIANARLRAGMSQGDLAKLLKLSRGAVGLWETGRSEPSAGNLRKAAKILRVAAEWLATGQGPSALYQSEEPVGVMAEGEKIDVARLGDELSRPLKAVMADREAEVWRRDADKLQAAGYHKGDFLVVDLRSSPKARDVVLAEVGGVPIFRLYLPPYLFDASIGSREPHIVADEIRVIVRGVVVSRFSFS